MKVFARLKRIISFALLASLAAASCTAPLQARIEKTDDSFTLYRNPFKYEFGLRSMALLVTSLSMLSGSVMLGIERALGRSGEWGFQGKVGYAALVLATLAINSTAAWELLSRRKLLVTDEKGIVLSDKRVILDWDDIEEIVLHIRLWKPSKRDLEAYTHAAMNAVEKITFHLSGDRDPVTCSIERSASAHEIIRPILQHSGDRFQFNYMMLFPHRKLSFKEILWSGYDAHIKKRR